MSAHKWAIVGTAQTWTETPWEDKSWTVSTLNDAYMLKFPRIDVHFEQHPLDRFIFRKKNQQHVPMHQGDIPAGYYLRPEGHLEWLKAQAQKIPVLLQQEPPKDWPKALRYPVEAIVKKYHDILFPAGEANWPKPYVACGPTWMVLWALEQGADHLGIWGIHLSTEREYIEQRPQFEGLCCWMIGKGIELTIPSGTPILKSKHVYCYEPRLSQAQDPLRYQLAKLNNQRGAIIGQLVTRKWWQGKQSLLAEVAELDARKLDVKQQLSRLQLQETMAGPEWRV